MTSIRTLIVSALIFVLFFLRPATDLWTQFHDRAGLYSEEERTVCQPLGKDCYRHFWPEEDISGRRAEFKNLLQRVEATNRLSLGAWGGSITSRGYYRRLGSWIKEHLGGVDVTLHPRTAGGTGPLYQWYCFEPNGDEQLILLDYSVNSRDEDIPFFERILRKLLSLPSAPVVIFVLMPTRTPPYSSKHGQSERDVAARYHIPVADASALYSRLLKENAINQSLYFVDEIHPSPLGESLIVSAVIRTLATLSAPKQPKSFVQYGGCQSSCLTSRADSHSAQALRPLNWTKGWALKFWNFTNLFHSGVREFSFVKQYWESTTPDSVLSLVTPPSTSVRLVVYQNFDMGIAHVNLDSYGSVLVDSYWPGFEYAPNRSRTTAVALGDMLPLKEHIVTVTVSKEKNPKAFSRQPRFQVIALLTHRSCD